MLLLGDFCVFSNYTSIVRRRSSHIVEHNWNLIPIKMVKYCRSGNFRVFKFLRIYRFCEFSRSLERISIFL